MEPGSTQSEAALPDAVAPVEDRLAGLVRLWTGYADKVYGADYPLYRAMASAIAGDRELLETLHGLRREARDPNMLLASIQYLVLGGAPHPLAHLYREAGRFSSEPVPDDLGDLVSDFCRRYRQELSVLLDTRHVQTNETGRCGGIALGLIEAAQRIGEPIALIDDGASAGLNLNLDEYLLDFGPEGSIGPTDSPVHLHCHVRNGPLPAPLRLPAIGPRLGIDRAPVDLHDLDTVRWMLACIWPGTGRQDRAQAAIRLAAGRRGLVRQGDMVADLGPALDDMHPYPTVVVTTWSYSYLRPESQEAFQDVLRQEGRRRPVAWLCCDQLGTVSMFEPARAHNHGGVIPSVLGLAVFHGLTVEGRALALMHPHGTWLDWLPPD